VTRSIYDDHGGSLLHDALFYRGSSEYAAGVGAFLEQGLRAGEAMLVAAPPDKLELLRSALGDDARRIRFEDMSDVGRNPNRILPLIHDWSERHRGRARFVGEPIWPGRTEAEKVEGARHEALINMAFGRQPLSILCPYDAAGLDPATLGCAERTHPTILSCDGERHGSRHYDDPREVFAASEWPLAPPAGPYTEWSFTDDLHLLREFVAGSSAAAAMTASRRADFVFALNEIAGNAIRHGAGHGAARIWRDDHEVIGEINGPGWVTDWFAGRRRPATLASGGRGLWLVNQLADLVELRTGPDGTTVRIHFEATGQFEGNRPGVAVAV
jgi:anti-sigma regulatory factor (Ser/Thr protein kinase)